MRSAGHLSADDSFTRLIGPARTFVRVASRLEQMFRTRCCLHAVAPFHTGFPSQPYSLVESLYQKRRHLSSVLVASLQ